MLAGIEGAEQAAAGRAAGAVIWALADISARAESVRFLNLPLLPPRASVYLCWPRRSGQGRYQHAEFPALTSAALTCCFISSATMGLLFAASRTKDAPAAAVFHRVVHGCELPPANKSCPRPPLLRQQRGTFLPRPSGGGQRRSPPHWA